MRKLVEVLSFDFEDYDFNMEELDLPYGEQYHGQLGMEEHESGLTWRDKLPSVL